MFILTKIADLVEIVAEDFSKRHDLALEDNINLKYANKVIQKIGLCICLFDILSTSEGLIGHQTGLINVNVEFRMIVFRPFKHEVMTGRISSATTAGLRIRTPFFSEIFVPAHKLPKGAKFDHDEQLWTWHTDNQTLFYDTQETVRIRIEDEIWHDQIPVGPKAVDDPTSLITGVGLGANGANGYGVNGGRGGSGEEGNKSPYQIVASMEDAGLGPCLWWDGGDEGGDEGGEEGEGWDGEEVA